MAFTSRLMSVLLSLVAMIATVATAEAQGDPKRAIEGTWLVRLTIRNCSDRTPIGSVYSLNTFTDGGNMLGTPSAPVGAIRTGHGVWTSQGGQLFRNQVALFAYDPQTGALAGIRSITRNIEVGPNADEFTSEDTDQLYDPATMTPIGSPGCATGAGRRLGVRN
jgi:hypothetical protein